MIPPWILESPLKAGIATMEAGGRLGLAARDTDLRQAAQANAAAEASDRLALSMQEMEERRQEANARLAESLRQQNALEQYRRSSLANQQVNQSALREQAKASAAATALHQAQQQQNWQADFGLRSRAQQRLEDKATEANDFTPGNAEDITLQDGTVVGHRWQRSPRVWESVKEPTNKAAAELSPTARVNALLHIATASPRLAAMDQSSPMYSGATNALAQANALLNPPASARPTMSDEDLAALFGGGESDVADAPAKEKRQTGVPYRTPKGVFKWTGSGWQTNE